MSLGSIALVVLPTTAICVALMLAVRRRESHRLTVSVDRGTGVLQVVGTAFSVLLAIVIFIALDSYDGARAAAGSEANDVVGLSRNVDLLAPANRAKLQGDLTCYGMAVINSEWPAMRHYRSSPLVNHWERALREDAGALKGGTPAQEGALQEVIGELDTLAEARRVRLTEAHPVIPQPIWVVLLLGGLLIVGIMLMVADRGESAIVQGFLMASVASLVAACLVLVWFFDHPYRNQAGSIRPVEMRHTIQVIQQEHPATPRPCRVTGQPV